MKRAFALAVLLMMVLGSPAQADGKDKSQTTSGGAQTIENAVRVTIIKSGGSYGVQAVAGGGSGSSSGCGWSVVFAPELSDAPYGSSAGPQPSPDAQFALLMCDGALYRYIWVAPDDVMDLDALAEAEARRYVEEVLVPDVGIGVNPSARGLVGLESWFWIEGFDGSVEAPPISAFGMSIGVRMTMTGVTWDFGDGTVEQGDLGRPYPEESTVRHTHQSDGTFTITATIALAPEYSVNGGAWTSLPALSTAATTDHEVEQRQAVISDF